jgi:hypothetical protein
LGAIFISAISSAAVAQSLPLPDWAIGPFSRPNIGKAVALLDAPCFQPQMPYETTGQYEAGTTFCEGLIRFPWKWLLYYRCAESFVGVAVAP